MGQNGQAGDDYSLTKFYLDRMYSDRSVPASKTKARLEELRDEILMKIDALGNVESDDDAN